MASDLLRNILSRLGLRVQGVAEIKFGRGVTSKTSTTVIFGILAIAAIAILAPNGPYSLVIIIIITCAVALYLLGTWIHTAFVPHEALEGAHLRAHLSEVNAKHSEIVDTEARVVRNPQVLAVETKQDEGGS